MPRSSTYGLWCLRFFAGILERQQRLERVSKQQLTLPSQNERLDQNRCRGVIISTWHAMLQRTLDTDVPQTDTGYHSRGRFQSKKIPIKHPHNCFNIFEVADAAPRYSQDSVWILGKRGLRAK